MSGNLKLAFVDMIIKLVCEYKQAVYEATPVGDFGPPPKTLRFLKETLYEKLMKEIP